MRLYLVSNGVPWDVAFSVEDDRAFAMWVIFGEFNGGEWDWSEMRWLPRRT